jgi:hypothetical protein
MSVSTGTCGMSSTCTWQCSYRTVHVHASIHYRVSVGMSRMVSIGAPSERGHQSHGQYYRRFISTIVRLHRSAGQQHSSGDAQWSNTIRKHRRVAALVIKPRGCVDVGVGRVRSDWSCSLYCWESLSLVVSSKMERSDDELILQGRSFTTTSRT